MKKTKHILLFLCVFISCRLSAQTHSINYTTANLNTTICNVFNESTPLVIGGYTHFPLCGGVTYTGATPMTGVPKNNLALTCMQNADLTQNLGTAYAIQFPFKIGNAYSISVTLTFVSSDKTSIPSVQLAAFTTLPDPNTTMPGACGSVNQNAWQVVADAGVGGSLVNSSQTTYTLANFTAPTAWNYLGVLVTQGSSTQPTTVYISNVTIKETALAFSLSPTTVAKICGTALTQNFSVTSNNGVTASSNTWNLGSASNGWLYNGSAAPQTITTSTSSISLASDVCSIPQSVSATATFNGAVYSTNTAIPSVTGTSATISGSAQICTSETYTINNLNCSGTVSWSVNPSTMGTLNTTTGNQVTLTRVGQGRTMTLSAIVTSSCGTFTVSQLIQVAGQPNDFGISIIVPCESGRVIPVCQFNAVPSQSGVTYNWAYVPTGGLPITISGTSSLVDQKLSIGTYTIQATASNACGFSDPASTIINVLACGGPEVLSADPAISAKQSAAQLDDVSELPSDIQSFHISPNPARGSVTISLDLRGMEATGKLDPTNPGIQNIKEIRIISAVGVTLRKQVFAAGTASTPFDISGLAPGIYFIQVYDGKVIRSQKLAIK